MKDKVHNLRAEWAYEKVKEAGNSNKEFRSLARSFPAAIQTNGMAAAVAFLFSKFKDKDKGKNPHENMYDIINGWLKERFGFQDNLDLMEHIVKMDSDTYRIYSDEIMNLCLWVKRFAEGMIDGGTEE